MKTLILSILAVVFLGCKKEKKMLPYFIGKWEYIEVVGYPFFNTYLPPGNGKTILIKEDGVYERRLGDSLLFKGQYSITINEDCKTGKGFYFTCQDEFTNSRFINVTDEKLSMASSTCLADWNILYYRKVE